MFKLLKVDLHLHSIYSNKIGDSVSWRSLAQTINIIKNANISVFSFTDHDMFSYKLYKETKDYIKNNNLNIVNYPGLELTIVRKNKKRGHVLFIFDNVDENKIKKLEEITFDIVFKYKQIKLEKAVEIYNKLELDYFIIPHVDKSDYLIYEDMASVKDKIYYLEALESSNRFKTFKKEAEDIIVKPVKFSDNHHWGRSDYFWTGTYLDKLESFDDLKWELKFLVGE